jgi:glycosyltransferase involved in cell wall biosynthesis
MAAVSVIIPAFNPGNLLRRALESVRSQTFSDWECVVVDDGSSEDLSWVRGFDTRVQLITQQNMGVSAARNVAAALTSAPLIAYLDQDDEWLPEKLAAQVQLLRERPEVGLCDSQCFILRDGELISAVGYDDHHGTYVGYLGGASIVMSTVVVRRDALTAAGGFHPNLRVVQDADVYLKILMLGWTAFRVQRPLARYFLHGGNQSADWRRFNAEATLVFDLHRLEARRDGDDQRLAAISRGVAGYRRAAAGQAFDSFRRDRSRQDLMFALRFAPRLTSSQLLKHLRRLLDASRAAKNVEHEGSARRGAFAGEQLSLGERLRVRRRRDC